MDWQQKILALIDKSARLIARRDEAYARTFADTDTSDRARWSKLAQRLDDQWLANSRRITAILDANR